MKTKQLATLCLAAVLLFVTAPNARTVALPGGATITPFWANTSSVEVLILSSGTSATCSVTVRGFSGSTVTSANMYLYKKNSSGAYVYETSWTSLSSSNNVLTVNKPYTVTRGAAYKLSVTAQVKRNGVTETVSNSHERVIP